MKAGQLLQEKGVKDFEIRITNGTDTMQVVGQLYGANVPSWLKVIPQNHNISEVFASADCFVSSSVTETFSYAICEATIFGLPVIQSDIEGTLWNADNPSVYLFKSEDINDLAEKMRIVMTEDKDILLRNCETTKNNNHSKYSLDSWTKNVIDFYNTI